MRPGPKAWWAPDMRNFGSFPTCLTQNWQKYLRISIKVHGKYSLKTDSEKVYSKVTLHKMFAKLNLSLVLFKKILTIVSLVFKNENKWIINSSQIHRKLFILVKNWQLWGFFIENKD